MTQKEKQAIIDNYMEEKYFPLLNKIEKEAFEGGWRELYESPLESFLNYLVEKKLIVPEDKKPCQKSRAKLE